MSVDLPKTNARWALFRILTRQRWGGEATSGANWALWGMAKRGTNHHGFYVRDFQRCCLPMIGRARFAYRFGRFDDAVVGSDRTSTTSPWDPDSDGLNLPDLAGHEVRIQAAPFPGEDSAPAWRTVWWGYVEYQEDVGWPGAGIPSGERIFHCVDALARTQRWQMDRHGFVGGGITISDAVGHPGYNVGRSRSGRRLANRSDTTYSVNGAAVKCHTQPGAGDGAWTDAQAIEHALAASRPAEEPLFTLSGTTDMLSGSNAWEVKDGDTVLDFLVRVCKRERGKGVVFADWTDDASAPTGPLVATLKVQSQFYSSITVDTSAFVTGTTFTGAANAAPSPTAVNVDLIGDHRLVESAFQLGSPDQWRYDYLETVGERIEVLATLAYQDGFDSANGRGVGIERRWNSAEQSTFEGLSVARRMEERYKPVYQLHGLRRGWGGLAGDGNGGNSLRVDFRCNDAGVIVVPNGTADTSPLLVDVLDDLPILEGYSYQTTTPARYDAQTETGDPQRKQMMVLLRVSSDRFLLSEQTAKPAVPRVDADGIWVFVPGDAGSGTRYISKTSTSSLAAGFNLQALGLTVGLRLPHRVRLASYAAGKSAADAKRRATIYHPDMHLWLAAANAIWDVDTSTGSVSLGHAPRRAAAGGTSEVPGILRDDRGDLTYLHTLAATWYLSERRTVSWTLRDCGFLPSFTNGDSTTTYPTLGQVVHEMLANGQTHTIDTPIVSVTYDNESGETTWETGWSSLDFDA